MIILDTRLKAVFELLKTGNVLADIGSDHAYLPIAMLETGKIDRAIITDVNDKPLEKSRMNIISNHLFDKCEFRLGSGLEIIRPGEADLISICGMGGDLIAEIIKKSPNVLFQVQRIVLQPMTNQGLLRKKVIDMGFQILEEKMVRDGHLFYQMFSMCKGQERFYETETDYEFPRLLIKEKNPVMKEYLEFQLGVQQRILQQLTNHQKTDLIEKCNIKIDEIEGVLEKYES